MRKRKHRRYRVNGELHDTPPWQERFLALRDKGWEYQAIAEKLNEEGFHSMTGKTITIDTLRCRIYNMKRRGT